MTTMFLIDSLARDISPARRSEEADRDCIYEFYSSSGFIGADYSRFIALCGIDGIFAVSGLSIAVVEEDIALKLELVLDMN